MKNIIEVNKKDVNFYEDTLQEKVFYLEKTDERLDLILTRLLLAEDLIYSRSEVTNLFKNGAILVDGKQAKKSGIKVDRQMKVQVFLSPVVELNYEGEKIDFDILFEDKHLLVINKPRGLVVHPAPGHPAHTLVNGLIYHFGNNLSDVNGSFRPGIVHRIDKDTSGLLVVAKTNQAHHLLAEMIAKHEVKRIYYALCHGQPEVDKGTIDAPIGRDLNNRQKMAIIASGKPSRTHFTVLEKFQKTSFLRVELETGRTHQIRVHMAYLRHPLVGDLLYAPKRLDYGLSGQALHAGEICFKHPFTKQEIKVIAPLPEWFDNLLSSLR